MTEELGTADTSREDRRRRITEGEWAGWTLWQGDAFETRAGPFYERVDEDGNGITAFRAGPEHMNGGGFMHGGCLMTFADAALFTIGRAAMEGSFGVTMNLSGDFLDSARVGEFVEARGEITRAARSIVFVRGLVTADGRPVLSFTGIIKKVGRR